MSRALLAAQEYPQRPQTAEDVAGFKARFHGRKLKKAGERVSTGDRRRVALCAVAADACKARRLGGGRDEIQASVDAGVCRGERLPPLGED